MSPEDEAEREVTHCQIRYIGKFVRETRKMAKERTVDDDSNAQAQSTFDSGKPCDVTQKIVTSAPSIRPGSPGVSNSAREISRNNIVPIFWTGLPS